MSNDSVPARRWLDHDLVVGAAVIVLAGLVRVAFIASTPASAPLSDMAEYWDRALYLFQHGQLYPDSWRMPGLPVALSAAFIAAGHASLEAARGLNVLAGMLATGLTYGLARRSAPSGWAAGAAAVVAMYPSLIVYSNLVATESLVIVPILGALVAATYPTYRGACALGALMGVAVLICPASVALLPAAIAAAVYGPGTWRLRGSRLAITASALCLTLLPWWWHNYDLHRAFVPFDTTGGLNVLIGAVPSASGRWDWSAVSQLQRTELAGIDVTTPAGSSLATARALGHIARDTRGWLALVPAKLTGLFALEGREQAYLYSIGYFGSDHEDVIGWWAWVILGSFPLLVLAAAAGLAVDGGLTRGVAAPALFFVVGTVVMHAASFGDPRFHLPLVPVLAVLATGLSRQPRRVIATRVAWLAVLYICLVPAWYAQLANYMDHLPVLTAPGGWQSHLSFDDLL